MRAWRQVVGVAGILALSTVASQSARQDGRPEVSARAVPHVVAVPPQRHEASPDVRRLDGALDSGMEPRSFPFHVADGWTGRRAPALPAPLPLSGPAEGFDSLDISDGGFAPPRPSGAAGGAHVVNTAGGNFAFHDKATGVLTGQGFLSTFFAPLSPLTPAADARVVYDPFEDRFAIVAMDVATSPTSSRILIAVSDDADPVGTWFQTAIESALTIDGQLRFAGDPGAAVDEEAIYVSANMFGFFSGDFADSRIWVVAKGAGTGGLYDGGSAAVSLLDPPGDGIENFALRPARVFAPVPTGLGTYFAAYNGLSDGSDEYLHLFRLDDPLGSPSFFEELVNLGDIESSTAPFSGAPQPEAVPSNLVSGDRRVYDAVWRDDALYVATQTLAPAGSADTGQVTVRWIRLDTSLPGSTTVAGQGGIGGEEIGPGTFTFYPSIAVNASSTVAVGFVASGSTAYPGSYYTFRKAGDPAGEVAPPRLLRRGLDRYSLPDSTGANVWGDTSSTLLDPGSDCFWFYNAHSIERRTSPPVSPDADGAWGTAWGEFCPDAFDCGDGIVEAGESCDPAAPLPPLDECGGCNCCIARPTPGCSNAVCEATVCAADPSCCNTGWDADCVAAALEIAECVQCCASDCCTDHAPDPGCEETACESLVCGIDPFCCSVEWDAVCVGEARSFSVCLPCCFPAGASDCRGSCSFCGDGLLDVGESCEPPDEALGCRFDCTRCGDRIVEPATGEQCDDGNASAGDGCAADCVLEHCGDGALIPPETCEPPGASAGEPDECRSDCTFCGDGTVNGGTTGRELIVNGGFESGDLAGWTVDAIGGGAFLPDAPGSTTPLTGASTAANPGGGSFYAVSDQTGPGTQAVSQTFTVPPGTIQVLLSFEMFVDDPSGAGPIVDPSGLDHAGSPNQHARVDLLAPGSPPFGTGSHVLANYYLGVDAGALPNPYASYVFDVSGVALPGETYMLRFAGTQNQLFLNQGIDNVSVFASLPASDAEECDDGNNFGGDGCSADCEIECGNGVLDPGESCDPPGPIAEGGECRMDCTFCGDGSVNGSVPVELLVNGDFETCDLGGWTSTVLGLGDFYLQTPGAPTPDTLAPTAPNPSGGSCYAVSDQLGPGTHALSQSFTVPTEATSVDLLFQLFANDRSGVGPIVDPAGLDHTGLPNQHARVDLLAAGSSPFDTGAGVLDNYYLGVDPAVPPNPYVDYGFDLTSIAAAGNTYQIRFAETENQFALNLGMDNVSVRAGLPAEECDDGNPWDGDSCSARCEPGCGSGTAIFGQTVLALAPDLFGWSVPVDVRFARGDLAAVSTYGVIASGSASSVSTTAAPEVPLAGGYYWLWKVDCPSSSWSSGGIGECPPGACLPGGRDGSLP